MSRSLLLGVGLVGALALWACGPTIGDACTTASQCGLGTCLQGAATPGGYCSSNCGDDAGTCPAGSTCAQAVSGVGPTCLLLCSGNTGCRQGYSCQTVDAGVTACLAP